VKSTSHIGRSDAFATRVLLVEDSAGDAGLVMSVLCEPPDLFEVQWVSSLGAATTELLESHYDCLLVDLGLPDGDGLCVVDTLREAAFDSAIVILTGRDDEALGVQAIQHGADDYFFKGELSSRWLHRSINHAIERTRSRVALERLVTRSTAVMAALGDALVVVDSDGLVVSANPAAAKLVGAPANEMVGLPIAGLPCTFLHGDGTPLAQSELASLQPFESGQSLRSVIRRMRRADGRMYWLEMNTHSFRTVGDHADGVVISARDITERLASEEAQRFQVALIGAVGQAVIAIDPQGLIVYWNKAAEHMYGWSEVEAVDTQITDLIPVLSSETAKELVKAVVSRSPWTGDLLVHRRDGTMMPVLVSATPMCDEHGELVAMIGIATDISERKRAEEAAQELSAIVESTTDGIVTMDLDGTIVTWNQGAEDLYGYPATEAIGQNMSILDVNAPGSERSSALTIVGTGESIRNLELVRRRRDGSDVDVSLTGSPIYDGDGSVVAIASIGRDISDRKRLEEELTRQAMHDSLTGLPNRTLLSDRLTQALAGADRRETPVSVLFLDLDQFKAVNDASGHLIGDELLVEVAQRLKGAIRPSDTLARFGGDEFVVVCEDADEVKAQSLAERLIGALKDPIEVGGIPRYISASIGIAVSPPLEADPNALLRYADTAMYDAKARGRARSRVFDASLATEAKDKMVLTSDLRDALRMGALEVYYQPVLELATGRVVGIEALTRWHHPVRGWIPPTTFVPLAEESGLIAAFDQWVLDRACRDGASLRALGLLPLDALLSVNISAHNVSDLELVDRVRLAADNAGFPLEALELEVTETAIMAAVPTIRLVLEGIRELGVGIALDDFGTGYSSLTFVQQLPVTTIKIDRSFIRHITNQPDDLAIASSVIDLARVLGLRTVAEGVEDLEQLSLLDRLGCEAGQGYLWSWAVPLWSLESRLSCVPQDFASARKESRWLSNQRHGQAPSIQKQRRKWARLA
jgi:diguanylate cyclase (GGDEF)-like protein/PAS domain S-box-containing protein